MHSGPFLQEINHSFCKQHHVKLYVWREDLNHPEISGNKFWKLKYNLEKAKEQHKKTLLTFGGAFSNHIYAFAAAGRLFGFNTVGVIRGEEVRELSPTLRFATACGMKIFQVSREEYRNKDNPDFLKILSEKFDGPYIIPEGGSNELAVKGCSEMIAKISYQSDFLCAPVGTGGTLAGIIKGMADKARILGFSSLKGGDFLKDDVKALLGEEKDFFKKWEIVGGYHMGGYGKCTPELADFIKEMNIVYDLPLEPIYTGKMFWGILDMINKGFFPKGTEILAIHTGGLQGLKGFEEKGITFR